MANNLPEPTPTPWYRVPVLWVGILVLATILLGCVHLIMISFEASEITEEGAGPAILGMPLTHSQPARSEQP